MSKDKIKVLLAMDADDGLAEDFRAILEEKGVSVESIEIRATKRLVRQYIQSNADVDAVILSQHIGDDSFSAREIDEISVAAPNALVIPIVDEDHGSRYMAELAALGVYNAIYDEDGNDELVAEFIVDGTGRDKMAARLYYGITGTEQAVEEAASAFDTRNAVDYLRRSEDDVRELRKKLLNLEKKLDTEELRQVLLDVPDSVFETAKNVPEYRVVCDMVAKERNRPSLPQGSEQAGEPLGTQKRRKQEKKARPAKEKKGLSLPFKKGNGKKDNVIDMDPMRLAKEERVGLVTDIGFISTNVGVGCTTAAIMCASSLANSGKPAKNVAIIELDADDHNFEELYKQVTSHANISGANKFTYGKVDYYFNIRYDDFCDTYRDRYDVVIYDFGSLDDETIKTFMPDMEKTFVVSSPKLWKTGELTDFLRSLRRTAPEVEKGFVYLFPSVSGQEVTDAAENVGDNLCVALPYDSNPFHPSDKTRQVFTKLFSGKYKQKRFGRKLQLGQRLKKSGESADGSLKKIFLAVSVAAVAAILAGTYNMSLQDKKYDDMYRAAGKVIAERDAEITTLKDEIAAAESSRAAEEKQVVVIKEAVYPGDLLTEENTEIKTVRVAVEKSLYLEPENVGKMAACVDMAPGTVVYKKQAAVPISALIGSTAQPETTDGSEVAADGEGAAEETAAGSETQ